MDIWLIVGQLGHLVAALAFVWLVLAGYRYVARRSRLLGLIVAVAILARVTAGLALFSVSYLHLPIAESLQVSGGFWQPALDATGYYQWASAAASARTLVPLHDSVPAPLFVNTLALWMMVVGISPATGVLLNLGLYVALVALLIRFFEPVNDWRRDLPCIVAVTAYSFSPVGLVHSTQPLKDELCNVLVATLCLAILPLIRSMQRHLNGRHAAALLISAVVVSGAIFGMAGIRGYLGLIMWCAVALALAVCAVRGRTTPFPLYLGASVVVLIAAWMALWGGTGSYYRYFWTSGTNLSIPFVSTDLQGLSELPYNLILRTRVARKGFLTSGGSTNIVISLRDDPAPGDARSAELTAADGVITIAAQRNREVRQARAAGRQPADFHAKEAAPPAPPAVARSTLPIGVIGRAIPTNVFEEARTAAWGLAVVFLPISLVETISGISIPGSRGLLQVTNVDTVFLDAAILFMLALLWTRRQAIGDRLPLVVFGVIFSATLAVLLGYVVTNFGTLWRMRPLVAVPLWVMAIAVSPRAETGARDDVRPSGGACGDTVVTGSPAPHLRT